MHEESVDCFEYLPAAHGVHFVARAEEPVSVIKPGWQGLQYP